MKFIKDVALFCCSLFCLIIYAVGALQLIPFIVFFIVLFRVMQLICTLLLYPVVYIVEKLSNGTFKQLKIRCAFTHTAERIYEDWRFIRKDLLDL